MKKCDCGRVSGMYTSEETGHAKVFGIMSDYSVIGFSNTSFIGAIADQRKDGDLPTGDGRRFEAFIIPYNCKSVTRYVG